MRDELQGRKSPEQLVQLRQHLWRAYHHKLRTAEVGLAQQPAAVAQLVGYVEVKGYVSHAAGNFDGDLVLDTRVLAATLVPGAPLVSAA